jgi:hypothetical protein
MSFIKKHLSLATNRFFPLVFGTVILKYSSTWEQFRQEKVEGDFNNKHRKPSTLT